MASKRGIAASAALVLGCAALPTGEPQLEQRAAAALESRGLGVEALRIVDNLLQHGPPAPRATPPLVLELLARPLAAADAPAIFRAAVPASLLALEGAPAHLSVDELLARYVEEVAQAQRLLREAGKPFEIDLSAMGLPLPRPLAEIARAVEAGKLKQANLAFIDATARLVAGLRAARGPFPAPRTFESPIGKIVIASAANDRHGPDAALILDPGGDDAYERAPARFGSVSIIVDFAGNDEYRGSDIALGAFSALVDLAGDDSYDMDAGGLAAAIAGASLLIDFAGNDTYRTKFFGQGAAALGIGVLLDLAGNDSYRVEAWGQGLGMGGGVGLLWDQRGNDEYVAAGVPDPYARGAGLSGAQGVGFGHREHIAGGIGILRDDAGDDRYEAQMFSQGSGYYYGIGLVWERAGQDRYQAYRYTQGNGTHQAVGVLRDEGGDDHYVANGNAQGMGLDVAVGLLLDAAGDDAYRAHSAAQGAATANGLGVLADERGVDRFELELDDRGWGRAHWMRGLPSVGLLLHSPGAAHFVRSGAAAPAPAQPPRVAVEPPSAERCPSQDPGEAVVCRVRGAGSGELEGVWAQLAADLKSDAAAFPAGWIAIALAKRPPSAARAEEIAALLAKRESCNVRALALRAWPTLAAAREGLSSQCFRLQAAARAAYERLGAPLPPEIKLPAFLRTIPPQDDTF